MPGLLDRKTQIPLPLRSSSILCEIRGFTARTTAILTYYNDNMDIIEGIFVLPIDPSTTVVEFHAVIENEYIYTEVLYLNEIKRKTTSFNDVEMQNGIFNVSIGNVSPWVLIEIQVTTVCEVGVMFFSDALRYSLPQAFSPIVVKGRDEETKQVNSMFAVSTFDYTFHIEILIEAPYLLCGVQSNTHPIQVDAPPFSEAGSRLRVSLPEEFKPTDEVFELLMFLCRPREPYIIIEEPKESEAVGNERNPISHIMENPILMLSYSPDIGDFCKEFDDPCVNQVAEFMLMIECNTLNKCLINKIQETSTLFLRCLPVNCFFNVISFSSDCKSVFPTNQAYSAINLEAACKYVREMGTSSCLPASLKKPIDWLYNQEEFPHVPKNVFIITSGNICFSNQVIDKVRKKHHIARCFTFCLGSTENARMMKTLSSLTKAQNVIIGDDERPHARVIECLKSALQPTVTNLKVSWILPDAYDVIYTPENLPSLLLGDRLNLFAILAVKDEDQSNGEKTSDTNSCVKEFWFEDLEPFDEFVDNRLNYDVLTYDTTETQSEKTDNDFKNDISFLDAVNLVNNSDLESEVFLTEEEASKFHKSWKWQKQSSLDRVQTWRVSKFPEKDMEVSDDTKVVYDSCSKEKDDFFQRQTSWGYQKKSSSIDGVDSTGSSNSYGSNLSSRESHFFPFPGYPTRLGSCRSIEERSQYSKSDDQSCTPMMCGSKERLSLIDRVHQSSHQPDLITDNTQLKGANKGHKRLTKTLLNENANTHCIDISNEQVIEKMLEMIVQDRRRQHFHWLNLQEEMTQCTWPLENERKTPSDKSDWRDSGIGNRSSSEARTSEPDEERGSSSFRKSQRSKSSSAFFDVDDHVMAESDRKVSIANEDDDKEKMSKTRRSTKVCGMVKTPTETTYASYETSRIEAAYTGRQSRKKFRPKVIWNSLLDKVKSLTSSVSEKSGEASFQFHRKETSKRDLNLLKQGKHKDNTKSSTSVSKFVKSPTKKKDEAKEKIQVKTVQKTNTNSNTPNTNTTISVKEKDIKATQRYIRNRPLIENSRTLSTTSMFEIGHTEIGDVDNLHLLPTHALIYLSGQYGYRSFKRIIPFQLVLGESKEGVPSDLTLHQLASSSIIRDLEIQMDHDEMLVETGRDYIKTLISKVSKSSHVLSKYTSIATMKENTDEDHVISLLKFADTSDRCSGARLKTYPGPIIESRKNSDPIGVGTKVPCSSNSTTFLAEKTGYMAIIELMSSDGYWELTNSFAEVVGVNCTRLQESCPFANPDLKHKYHDYYENKHLTNYEKIWVTALAIIWLRNGWMDFEKEWILIDMKVRQWLGRQRLPKGFLLEEVFLISQQTFNMLMKNRNTAV